MGWGPVEAYLVGTREAVDSLALAGFAVELDAPNLPVVAPEGETKRLAKKHKEGDTSREWRGDAAVLLQEVPRIKDLMLHMRDVLGYDMLVDLCGVDPSADSEKFWVVWQLMSIQSGLRVQLRAEVPKDAPSLDTVTSVYPGADWHEREAAEMFGLVFNGHPDPRNMLLPDDWVGYPLRKDYEFPEEYNGISCV